MRTRIQCSAQAILPQDAERLVRRPRSGTSQDVAKALATEKKLQACRASQMKLFWVFQV